MSKAVKTNAMRILDKSMIEYQSFQFTANEENTDGTLVARKNDRNTALVHKTLVTKNSKNELFVFVIPIAKELDLKKAAKTAGEKKIEMLPQKDLLKYTGYVKGGCSPVGMKKLYPTFIEESSTKLSGVIVSAGKKGYIIEISIENLQLATKGNVSDLCKEESSE